jgi:CubicO group peptidase (beta-lactamase class C family)
LSIEGLEPFYYRSEDAKEADKRSYGMQPHPALRDSLYSWIRSSSVRKEAGYRYSDIGFMILQNIVESVTGLTLDQYVHQNFYDPLNLQRTIFNPNRRQVDNYLIAPTEYDYYFRDAQVWGEVHDRNAAILGGVAGHAGLFSTAKDLAIVLQMILQEGEYGGIKFFEKETLDTFNKYYFPGNRRGLGWDKPGDYNPSVSAFVSQESFGHTGFTGTLVWVDPTYDIVYIFLSNRIFPDSNNWRINKLETRRRIHDLIYKSLNAY